VKIVEIGRSSPAAVLFRELLCVYFTYVITDCFLDCYPVPNETGRYTEAIGGRSSDR
jgi:hypothetical protein